jgi:xanthine dehydrogenase accessory factor
VAQPLVSIASAAGLDVLIVDPREAFATEDRFPGVAIVRGWPDRVLREAGLDHRSAVVALTHDPKIDEPAIERALASKCFYVGALGSKKTHGRRVESLKKRGVPEEAIARIHAPIGLSIGAASPPEIALAILAEITMRLRRGPEAKP